VIRSLESLNCHLSVGELLLETNPNSVLCEDFPAWNSCLVLSNLNPAIE